MQRWGQFPQLSAWLSLRTEHSREVVRKKRRRYTACQAGNQEELARWAGSGFSTHREHRTEGTWVGKKAPQFSSQRWWKPFSKEQRKWKKNNQNHPNSALNTEANPPCINNCICFKSLKSHFVGQTLSLMVWWDAPLWSVLSLWKTENWDRFSLLMIKMQTSVNKFLEFEEKN